MHVGISQVTLTAVAAAALVLAPVSAQAAGAGGVGGPAFYVDGVLYRTVATPNDLSGTGAPEHSFDVIYDFGGAQRNVATAAPGDSDYNGGAGWCTPSTSRRDTPPRSMPAMRTATACSTPMPS